LEKLAILYAKTTLLTSKLYAWQRPQAFIAGVAKPAEVFRSQCQSGLRPES